MVKVSRSKSIATCRVEHFILMRYDGQPDEQLIGSISVAIRSVLKSLMIGCCHL